MFLELNEISVLQVPNDEVYDFVIGVATGSHELGEIADQLRRLVLE